MKAYLDWRVVSDKVYFFPRGSTMIKVLSDFVQFDENREPYIEFPMRKVSLDGVIPFYSLVKGDENAFLLTITVPLCEAKKTEINIDIKGKGKTKVYKLWEDWSSHELRVCVLVLTKSNKIKVKKVQVCDGVEKTLTEEIHTID